MHFALFKLFKLEIKLNKKNKYVWNTFFLYSFKIKLCRKLN